MVLKSQSPDAFYGGDVPFARVLGIPVHAVTYESALAQFARLARCGRPAAVTASNTHLISLGRHSKSFGDVLRSFDLVLPDGMPLIWSLRLAGYALPDRVYGPYFMRRALIAFPRPWRHFFFGGTEQTLAKLCIAARKLQPDIEIAGALSPPFGPWNDEQEAEFARAISESGADFIWIALGGEKQERWILKNLPRFKKGVFVGIGDAFALLSGQRTFAPDWMQRYGLTWAYRLFQEPRRLWKRYLKYNSLFLFYSARDALFGTPVSSAPSGSARSIVFMGCRGTPARYAGFESVVENLGALLVKAGYEVRVFNRPALYPDRPTEHLGMRIQYIPTIQHRSLETIVHTTLSTIALLLLPRSRRPSIAYLCGVGNAALAWPLRLAGIKVVANVDGTDFKREKWGLFAQWWLWWSERLICKTANCVVADNLTVVRHYEKAHSFTPKYISYGAHLRNAPPPGENLARLGLKPGGYFLFVGRLSKENCVDLAIRGYELARCERPLVIVGEEGYERAYGRYLRSIAGKNIIFAGAVYGEGYWEISGNARAFLLPATIEATRLVLLDQMGLGKAVVYQDCEATREVIGDAGAPFRATGSITAQEALAAVLERLDRDDAEIARLGEAARERARLKYNWEAVTQKYIELFDALCTPSAPSTKR
jgi:N-acetylglucosaminyldiphosphoundecaprenol N-acetyl-beta-D-mannosaminyltransferase